MPDSNVARAGATSPLAGLDCAIVGGGLMGGGIAQVLARRGARCRLWDVSPEQAAGSVERIIDEATSFEATGLFEAGSGKAIADRVTAAVSLERAVVGAALIVEAVPESLETKLPALRAIAEAADPGAVIGTNTSSISIARLSVALPDPSRFLGIHWFNPAPFVPGIELIPGPGTSADVVERVLGWMRDAGKRPTVIADSPGFICNRLQLALFREATTMVEEGLATPDQVDEVVRTSFGFRLPIFGPFALADMAGLDVYAAILGTLEDAYGSRFACPPGLRRLVDSGQLGLKSGGKGYLDRSPAEYTALTQLRNVAFARLTELVTSVTQASTTQPAPGQSRTDG